MYRESLLHGKSPNVHAQATKGAGCNGSSAISSISTSISAVDVSTTSQQSPETEGTKADMSKYLWLLDDDHAFLAMTMAQSNKAYEDGMTAILYYGYAGCDFCERAVPIINEAAKEIGVKVYYIDVYEDARTDEEIDKMLANLDPALSHEYDEYTGKLEPVMYTPEVVVLHKGTIISHHTSLVDDFVLTKASEQMSDTQKQHLKEIYLAMFSLVLED